MAFMLVLAWGLTNQAQATHLAGAELNYTYNGVNPDGTLDYTVTVTWTRDCGGVNLGAPVISVAGCGFSDSATPTCGQGVTVPGLCGNDPCANPPAGLVGYEQITCTVDFDLPAAPCGNYVFSTTSSDRNGAISTLTNTVVALYVESTLNNLNGNQSGPSFGNLPLLTICAGQPFNFNNQGQSGAGGTLTYQLITPMTGANTTVNYSGGFGANNPFQSNNNPALVIDPNTGALSGTPSAQAVTVWAVLVTETDANGNVIGTAVRDIQVQIIPCNNQNPTINPVTVNDTICVGVQYQLTLNSNDADGDNVTMSWGQEINGATFGIANNGGSGPFPTGTFTWTPGQNDVGNHTFTVGVIDNACPVNGSNTYTYNLTVINCCDDFEFNVASCCEVEIETGGRSVLSSNSANRAAAIAAIDASSLQRRSTSPLPDSCDPCIDGWYPVWVEDDNGQPVGFGDPCITVEWLDAQGTVLFTGWSFPATPDIRYTVRVTNTCNGCTWEEEFFYCCEKPDPGFTFTTQCTANNFIITVTNTTPSTNSQFNLYTAHSPCTAGSCMVDPLNPDQVAFGNTVTFTLPKIGGAMYVIKHGEWTLCDSWQEQRQLVVDTCCLDLEVSIHDCCGEEALQGRGLTTTTASYVDGIYDDLNKRNGTKLSRANCDRCANPNIPFVIVAVDGMGDPINSTTHNITWTSSNNSTSTDNWILAYVDVTYYVEVVGPNNCIHRDTFLVDCCPVPLNPTCTLDRSGNPTFSWDPIPGITMYEVVVNTNDRDCCIRPSGLGQSQIFTVTGTSFTPNVSFLCASWMVRAICRDGSRSGFTRKQCICTRRLEEVPHELEIGKAGRSGDLGDNLKSYPSPASNYVTVEGTALTLGSVIEMIDISGKVVLTQKVEDAEGKQRVRVAELHNGIYFLRVNGASASVKKVVIQH